MPSSPPSFRGARPTPLTRRFNHCFFIPKLTLLTRILFPPAMSRRNIASYMNVLQPDDSSVACAVWLRGPNFREEEVGHFVLGKSTARSSSDGRLELSRYNFKSDILSAAIDSIEEDLFQSVAVHPGGDHVVCSFMNSCKLYVLERGEQIKLKPSSEEQLLPLKGIGPQSSLTFNADGSMLAAGGKDGHLRVFQWPSLNILFDQPDGCKFLSSLDISLDGAFLAAIPENGSFCRIWNIVDATVVATISTSNKGERFGLCKFSRDGAKPFLFITINRGGKGIVGVWVLDGWSKVGVKMLSKDVITSFAISHHGKWLGLGSISGDIYLIEVKKMQIVEFLKGAHLPSSVKYLEFSPNSRAFLSVSSDSTARVIKLTAVKEWKEWQLYALLIGVILLSALVFYIFYHISDSFWNFPMGRDQPARPPVEAIYGNWHNLDREEHDL